MPLVSREQVLKLLQQGKSIDEIQKSTGASRGAVKVHIRRLKDTGRWAEPQQAFPAGQPEQATIPTSEQPPTPTSSSAPETAKPNNGGVTFKSKADIIDFLVARLQESKKVCDTEKLLGQKDYEIGRLTEQNETLQAKLARLESGIAALKV